MLLYPLKKAIRKSDSESGLHLQWNFCTYTHATWRVPAEENPLYYLSCSHYTVCLLN